MSWIGYDDEKHEWMMHRVTLAKWSLDERRQVRVDLNVLYGSLGVFVNDMDNAVMSHDEVGFDVLCDG